MRPDRPCLVHRNLARSCWSVVQGGRVVAHMDSLMIESPTFVVRKGGLERARKERRRGVHAFVRGLVLPFSPPPQSARRASYHYQAGHFYLKDTGEPAEGADAAYFNERSELWLTFRK